MYRIVELARRTPSGAALKCSVFIPTVKDLLSDEELDRLIWIDVPGLGTTGQLLSHLISKFQFRHAHDSLDGQRSFSNHTE